MIGKILLIAALVAFIYFLFFRGRKVTQKTSEKKDNKKVEEIMVECDKCSTFISQKEAIIKDGKYFCSKECAGL